MSHGRSELKPSPKPQNEPEIATVKPHSGRGEKKEHRKTASEKYGGV